MDPRKLNVGERVAIGRLGGRMGVVSLGTGIVTKKNRVRITVVRESDSFEWNFSAKFGELILGGGRLSYEIIVESPESVERREQQIQREAEVNRVLSEIEFAAGRRNVKTVLEHVAGLQQLLNQ